MEVHCSDIKFLPNHDGLEVPGRTLGVFGNLPRGETWNYGELGGNIAKLEHTSTTETNFKKRSSSRKLRLK